MHSIAIILLLLGAFGVLGMTWFFPVVARFQYLLRSISRKASGAFAARHEIHKIDILIPAHNEETLLPNTLNSISEAILHARFVNPQIEVHLKIGADGCRDRTVPIAHAFKAQVFEFSKPQGKWKTLVALVSEARESDWIIFADAGVLWEKNFLLQLIEHGQRSNVVAVAPTYQSINAGSLETVSWAVERHLKSIESSSGGPISMHGATVAYRGFALRQVMNKLAARVWLNDDIVLPLVLRATFPQHKIVYDTKMVVYDQPPSPKGRQQPQRDFGRRRRLVMGNIQWVSELFPTVVRANPTVGILALRRVFRLFWAYWGVLLGAGLLLLIVPHQPHLFSAPAFLAFSALFVLAVYRSNKIRKILDSVLASLLAPYYFCFSKDSDFAGWK